MANEEEPSGYGEGPGGPEDLSQDPFVERLRPDPAEPPEQVRVLEGLLGESDREGYWRLYFTRELDYYAEFRADDVVYTEPIPPDQPPFVGQQATRVGIRRDATVEFTQARTPRPVDEFDLDVRLAAPGRAGGLIPPPTVIFDGCPTEDTCRTQCGQFTCETCRTRCGQPTCQTCQTRCGQPTCAQTCQTCQTQCGQATCQTCQTQCGQPTCFGFTCFGTCQTCRTQCGQWTCDHVDTEFGPGCHTFNPHVFTCGPRCVEP